MNVTSCFNFKAIENALNDKKIVSSPDEGLFRCRKVIKSQEKMLPVVKVRGENIHCEENATKFDMRRAKKLYQDFEQWRLTTIKKEDDLLETIVTPGAAGATGGHVETSSVLVPFSTAEQPSSDTVMLRFPGYTVGGESVEFAGTTLVLPENPKASVEIQDFFPKEGFFMTREQFERENAELCKLVKSSQFRARHYPDINGFEGSLETQISNTLRLMHHRKDTGKLIEPLIKRFNEEKNPDKKQVIADQLVNLMKSSEQILKSFIDHLGKVGDSEKNTSETSTALIPIGSVSSILRTLKEYTDNLPSRQQIRDSLEDDFGFDTLHHEILSEFRKKDGAGQSINQVIDCLRKIIESGNFVDFNTGAMYIPGFILKDLKDVSTYTGYCKQLIRYYKLMKNAHSYTRDAASKTMLIDTEEAARLIKGFAVFLDQRYSAIMDGSTATPSTLKG